MIVDRKQVVEWSLLKNFFTTGNHGTTYSSDRGMFFFFEGYVFPNRVGYVFDLGASDEGQSTKT
jgi:hypothetical protein